MTTRRVLRSRVLIAVLASIVALAVAAVVVGLVAVPRSSVFTVGQTGGTVGPADGARVAVAPGALDRDAQVTIRAVPSPQAEKGADAYSVRVGDAVDITAPRGVWGSRIEIPLDRAAQRAAAGPLATPANAFIALWSDAYETWIPLESTYSPRTRSVSAVAPHFSRFSLRSVKEHVAAWTPDASGALAAVRSVSLDAAGAASDASRAAAGALERAKDRADAAIRSASSAGSAAAKTAAREAGALATGAWNGVGGAAGWVWDQATIPVDRADCGDAPGWRVTATDDVVDACVDPQPDGSARIRFTETGYLRYLIGTPDGTNIRPTALDVGAGPADILTRLLHYPVGQLPVPSRDGAQLTLTASQVAALQRANASARFTAEPDYAGVAFDSALALLTLLPVARLEVQVVSRVEVRAVIESAIATETGTIVTRQAVTASLEKVLSASLNVEEVRSVIELVDCVAAASKAFVAEDGVKARLEVASETAQKCAGNAAEALKAGVAKSALDAAALLSTLRDVQKTAFLVGRLGKDTLTGSGTATITVSPPQIPRVTGFDGRDYGVAGAGVRPTTLTLFNDAVFQDLTWATWTTDVATATGTASVNTCDPDCASGNYSTSPVTLSLSEPVEVCGGLYFSRLAFTLEGRTSTTDIAPTTLGGGSAVRCGG